MKHASNYSKNLNPVNSKKHSNGEKEGEKIPASRKTIFHGAGTLGLEPIYEAKSGKELTMDQVPDICNRVNGIATFDIRRECVTIKMYSMNKPHYT